MGEAEELTAVKKEKRKQSEGKSREEEGRVGRESPHWRILDC